MWYVGLGIVMGSLALEAAKSPSPRRHPYPTTGSIERLDPALQQVLSPEARIEKLARGFLWPEGAVWDSRTQTLLFSDPPRNVIFQWKEGVGTRDFLIPSGYTGHYPKTGKIGSSGLAFDREGRLLICQQGNRQIVRMDRKGKITIVVRYYKNRRLNSPHDLVLASNGNLYFTDPPFGLPQGNQDPFKELVFNGVFLLRPNGQLVLLTDQLSMPAGITLSPDEKKLYVTVADPAHPMVMEYPIQSDGTIGKGIVRFRFDSLRARGWKGLPYGITTDQEGRLYVAGPGGVSILDPKGKLLGIIRLQGTVLDCAWGDDGKTLYITSNPLLCRVKTLVSGRGFPHD